ncbi:Uncharacterised protein [Mycobacterium tuberculosis]|nr:Uncharacterised protein [Mycobacterium tuberculosis]
MITSLMSSGVRRDSGGPSSAARTCMANSSYAWMPSIIDSTSTRRRLTRPAS